MSAAFAANNFTRDFSSRRMSALCYVLWGLALSPFSLLKAETANAEAAPSQEFWNYFAEFGDAQGDVFDPSDYAAIANIRDKAQAELKKTQGELDRQKTEGTSTISKPENVSPKSTAAQEQSR